MNIKTTTPSLVLSAVVAFSLTGCGDHGPSHLTQAKATNQTRYTGRQARLDGIMDEVSRSRAQPNTNDPTAAR